MNTNQSFPKNEIYPVEKDAWRYYLDQPFPGWGTQTLTLFNQPSTTLDRLEDVDYVVFSVPFDGTASTRQGAKYGPRFIREASLSYSSQLTLRGPVRLRNMRTGALQDVKVPTLVDVGDFHVYPSNPHRQMQATAAETMRAAAQAKHIIMLGGEHSLSFASFCGLAAARAGQSIGYVQIDHHFDFGNESTIHGPYYHGSNARRISEHPSMSLTRMGFVGSGDLTSAKQYDYLIENGVSIRSISQIRELGFESCLRAVLDQVASEADILYVSIDIDVCDTATVTGTGHVTVGGITCTEFLSIASILHDYPVVALDIVEVSPAFDPSGATASLVARFLFEWLFLVEV